MSTPTHEYLTDIGGTTWRIFLDANDEINITDDGVDGWTTASYDSTDNWTDETYPVQPLWVWRGYGEAVFEDDDGGIFEDDDGGGFEDYNKP